MLMKERRAYLKAKNVHEFFPDIWIQIKNIAAGRRNRTTTVSTWAKHHAHMEEESKHTSVQKRYAEQELCKGYFRKQED